MVRAYELPDAYFTVVTFEVLTTSDPLLVQTSASVRLKVAPTPAVAETLQVAVYV